MPAPTNTNPAIRMSNGMPGIKRHRIPVAKAATPTTVVTTPAVLSDFDELKASPATVRMPPAMMPKRLLAASTSSAIPPAIAPAAFTPSFVT